MKAILALFLSLFSSVLLADNPYTVESAIYKVVSQVEDSVNFGTGVLIARDKILTNCHVVNDAFSIYVEHRKTSDRFKVVRRYNLGSLDACILVGDFVGQPVKFASEYVPGENIWIFGFPAGIPVIGRGIVDRLVDTDRGKSLLLGAFCAPGSSGGPVVNVRGELIGLNFGVFKYQNQCLSIPARAIFSHLS